MEEINCLQAISPIDGRYVDITSEISEYFSEYAYIKYRVLIEVDWLKYFAKNVLNEELEIDSIVDNFDLVEAKKVKIIEEKTKHDVKAIEYYLREKLKELDLSIYESYIHFGCTSEDVNNLAYGKMVNGFMNNIFYPKQKELVDVIEKFARDTKGVAMLSHTHGQKATPTTVGKEWANFAYRYNYIMNNIKNIKLKGKFSGAVGNFNAMNIAYPEIDVIDLSRQFVESEGIEFNYFTTQIESHDVICMLFSMIKMFNNITMDFNSDMWMYISMDYYKQKAIKEEVGSSVMPHKVNPIYHENSMANIRIANSIFDSFINNLQVSRMQRDLSDSSMLRNIGVAMAHTLVSIEQTKKAISRMSINEEVLKKEVNESTEVLAEAIQTVLRKNNVPNAYEVLKELTRAKKINIEDLRKFIHNLDIDENDKERLLNLTPETYVGLAEILVDKYL